ncbi:MAG TPA: AAA family ATPase [Candidatus Saccharimonadales bacterium]|jgi:dephospho-CoA kinase
MSLIIIGIAGTNGAGKDTVGRILAERHGYLFVSVTDVLRAELKRRGDPIDREHLRGLSAEWRREFGYGVLIDRALESFKSALATDTYAGMAVASLRNPFEVDRIHELEGQVWWVDADPRLRFDRIQRNAATRARAAEDEKTFEEFLAEEEAEMHTTGDAATLNMAAVRDKCDVKLQNGGNELAMLEEEIAAKFLKY